MLSLVIRLVIDVIHPVSRFGRKGQTDAGARLRLGIVRGERAVRGRFDADVVHLRPIQCRLQPVRMAVEHVEPVVRIKEAEVLPIQSVGDLDRTAGGDGIVYADRGVRIHRARDIDQRRGTDSAGKDDVALCLAPGVASNVHKAADAEARAARHVDAAAVGGDGAIVAGDGAAVHSEGRGGAEDCHAGAVAGLVAADRAAVHGEGGAFAVRIRVDCHAAAVHGAAGRPVAADRAVLHREDAVLYIHAGAAAAIGGVVADRAAAHRERAAVLDRNTAAAVGLTAIRRRVAADRAAAHRERAAAHHVDGAAELCRVAADLAAGHRKRGAVLQVDGAAIRGGGDVIGDLAAGHRECAAGAAHHNTAAADAGRDGVPMLCRRVAADAAARQREGTAAQNVDAAAVFAAGAGDGAEPLRAAVRDRQRAAVHTDHIAVVVGATRDAVDGDERGGTVDRMAVQVQRDRYAAGDDEDRVILTGGHVLRQQDSPARAERCGQIRPCADFRPFFRVRAGRLVRVRERSRGNEHACHHRDEHHQQIRQSLFHRCNPLHDSKAIGLANKNIDHENNNNLPKKRKRLKAKNIPRMGSIAFAGYYCFRCLEFRSLGAIGTG